MVPAGRIPRRDAGGVEKVVVRVHVQADLVAIAEHRTDLVAHAHCADHVVWCELCEVRRVEEVRESHIREVVAELAAGSQVLGVEKRPLPINAHDEVHRRLLDRRAGQPPARIVPRLQGIRLRWPRRRRRLLDRRAGQPPARIVPRLHGGAALPTFRPLGPPDQPTRSAQESRPLLALGQRGRTHLVQ
eukprot:1690856-Prymnesium_polylepis.1